MRRSPCRLACSSSVTWPAWRRSKQPFVKTTRRPLALARWTIRASAARDLIFALAGAGREPIFHQAAQDVADGQIQGPEANG